MKQRVARNHPPVDTASAHSGTNHSSSFKRRTAVVLSPNSLCWGTIFGKTFLKQMCRRRRSCALTSHESRVELRNTAEKLRIECYAIHVPYCCINFTRRKKCMKESRGSIFSFDFIHYLYGVDFALSMKNTRQSYVLWI